MFGNASQLAYFIKIEMVLARDVRVGDIVVCDYCVYRVARIESTAVQESSRIYDYWKTAAACITLLDASENGSGCPDDKGVTIISRAALRDEV